MFQKFYCWLHKFNKGCFTALLLLILKYAFTQSSEVNYAHWVMDTLCSPAMDGRGYVDSGDFKAANFIKNEIKSIGLQPIKNSYFQTFLISPNVYPNDLEVRLNDSLLTPGVDFLIEPFSGDVKGTFELIWLDAPKDTSIKSVGKVFKSIGKAKPESKIISIRRNDFTKEQYQDFRLALISSGCWGAKGCLEFTTEKLTWDASEESNPFCYIKYTGPVPTDSENHLTINVQSRWKKEYYTQNIIGFKEGTAKKDSFIVFSAHYDHLGQMGNGTYFPGANDNASGTSMVLNLAKYFAVHPTKYSVAFIFFSGEELGLLGSTYYTAHPMFPLEKIKFLVNLDIVGTGDDGIKVVNATEFPNQFDKLVKLNNAHSYLKQVSPRGPAANSDHYPFFVKGVPCFFIYTLGGIAAYHDIYDKAETLPLTDYEDLFRLLVDFTAGF